MLSVWAAPVEVSSRLVSSGESTVSQALPRLPRGLGGELTTLVWAFILVTSLFFLWGFAYGLLDVLNKHFQNILGITKLQSTGLQSESLVSPLYQSASTDNLQLHTSVVVTSSTLLSPLRS